MRYNVAAGFAYKNNERGPHKQLVAEYVHESKKTGHVPDVSVTCKEHVVGGPAAKGFRKECW